MNSTEVISKLIEKLIIPQYPFLKLWGIETYIISKNREYMVRFITKKKLDVDIQMKIDSEVKSIFRMTGLDDTEGTTKNKITSWFKYTGGKYWSFTRKDEYEH